MTQTEAHKQKWYSEAAEELGFDYSKTLTINESINIRYISTSNWRCSHFNYRTILLTITGGIYNERH